MITPPPGVVKVNLGSGLAVAPGWINVDATLMAAVSRWPRFMLRSLYGLIMRAYRGPDEEWVSETEYLDILKANTFVHNDVRYGIPLPDTSADYVFSSHMLEHLTKDEALRVMKEARRVMKPGAFLRVCVPDLEHVVALYQSGRREEALDLLYTPGSSSFHQHHYMYDFQLLWGLLEEAGFTTIERHDYREGNTPDLDRLDNRADHTLYVEVHL